jgi:hypothetical protein
MTSNSEVTSDGVQTAWEWIYEHLFHKGGFTLMENLVTRLKNCFVKIGSQGTLRAAYHAYEHESK